MYGDLLKLFDRRGTDAVQKVTQDEETVTPSEAEIQMIYGQLHFNVDFLA